MLHKVAYIYITNCSPPSEYSKIFLRPLKGLKLFTSFCDVWPALCRPVERLARSRRKTQRNTNTHASAHRHAVHDRGVDNGYPKRSRVVDQSWRGPVGSGHRWCIIYHPSWFIQRVLPHYSHQHDKTFISDKVTLYSYTNRCFLVPMGAKTWHPRHLQIRIITKCTFLNLFLCAKLHWFMGRSLICPDLFCLHVPFSSSLNTLGRKG